MKKGNKPTLIWLQSITCNGNSHSFLNHPSLLRLLSRFEIIYHPLLQGKKSLEELLKCEMKCDILLIEGALTQAGFRKQGVEVADFITRYAKLADRIITVGTCATFGGVFRQKDPQKIGGFCFDEEMPNGRYKLFAKKLISLPGCPIHPKWLGFVLEMVASGKPLLLDAMHRPKELYAYTVHHGCMRNEYFEWKIDALGFGLKEGCLYYNHGCQGPYTRGSCNKILWNELSSKTRTGSPCFGCTEPTFPQTSLFRTQTHMGIPAKMPLGIPRRAYLTYTGVVKSFTIKRFSKSLLEYES